jgi:tape measure domain-containing protein
MLNLGTLLFGLGVDTRGLTSAISEVERFGRTVQGAQTAANRGFNTAITTLRRQENTLLSGLERIRSAQERISNMNLSPTARTNAIDALNKAYAELSQRVTSTAAGLDSTKIDRATTAFQQLTNEIVRGATQQAAAITSAEKATERHAAAMHRAQQQAMNLGGRIDRAPMSPQLGYQGSAQRQGLQQEIEAALNTYRTQMATATTGQTQQFTRQWTAAINDINRKFASMGKDVPANGLENWRKGIHALGSASLLASGHLGGMSTRMFALANLISEYGLRIGVVGGTLVGFASIAQTLASSMIASRLELEKTTKALTAVEGNAAVAAVTLDYIREVSDRSGISIRATASSYMRLSTSAKAAGMATDEMRNIFETFAMASGTLSLSMEDTQGVFRAIDQMMSKGTVQAEELRGQLGDRLPGAFAIAAQAMGVTTRELGKMMKAGEVISSEFLPKFAAQVRIVLGLNLNDNINSLQASMSRLENAWLFFNRALDNSLGFTQAYKSILEALANTLNTLSKNMDGLAGAAGALVGALAGLAAAFAAIMIVSAVSAAMSGVGAAATALVGVFSILRAATTSLAAAQMALYAVMATTPWGAAIAGLVKIAAVIGGAYLGYNLMTDAVNSNNAALADTSAINEYIENQKRAGWQVRDTTARIMEQVAAMRVAAIAQAETAVANQQATRGGPNMWDYLQAGGLRARGINATPGEAWQRRRDQANQEVIAAQRALNAANRAVQGIKEVATLPNMPTGPGGVFGDDDGKGAKKLADEMQRGADAAKELMDALNNVNDAMVMVFQGTLGTDFAAVDAIMEAREMIQGMNANELKGMAEAFGMSGASAEQLENHVAGLIGATNQATDSIKEYRSVIESIKSEMEEMAGNQWMVDAIMGGASDEELQQIEAMNKALETVAKFKEQGASGAKALESLRQALNAAGFAGDTAAEALARFYKVSEDITRSKDAAESMKKTWEELARSIEETEALADAYAKGDRAGEAMERQLEIQRKLIEYRKEMETLAKTQPGLDVDAEVDALAASLGRLDEAQQNLERIKETMAELRGVWDDAFQSMYDNLIAVAQGTKSVGEAITDLFMGILDNLAQNALKSLTDELWNMVAPTIGDALGLGALGGMVGGGRGGNAQQQQAAAASAATVAVTKMAMAADLAALSLQRIAGMSGFAGGGGGLGGFLGSAMGVIGSLFGGGAGGAAAAGTVDYMLASGASPLQLLGRASGGPVTKGWGYVVNEQGANGEVFFPGTSGYVGKPQGGGNSISIDASTTIDARGAAADQVANLRQEMNARDARLRAELPYLIDRRTLDSRMRLRQ